MPAFTWVSDVPGGPLKNHEISGTVYRGAIAETVFMQHVKVKKNLSMKSGESMTLPRTAAPVEQTSYVLVETQDIPERTYVVSAINVTALEVGSAIPYTALARDFLVVGLEQGIRDNLMDEQRLMLDSQAAAALKLGKIKYAVTGVASNTITTNGTFGATSTSTMNLFHAAQIADYLYATLRARPAENGDYIGIFAQRSMRGIMDDPSWEEWHKYTDPEAKYNGEVGRLDRIRFIGTNHTNALANVGTGGVLGEGMVLGKEALCFLEARPVELYVTPPKGHAGRFLAISFYGILGFRAIWEDSSNAGEANYVHVGSA